MGANEVRKSIGIRFHFMLMGNQPSVQNGIPRPGTGKVTAWIATMRFWRFAWKWLVANRLECLL